MWRFLFLSSFAILFHEGFSLTGKKECPEPKDVQPCVCYYLSGHAYLRCQNLTDPVVLRRIFTEFQSYEFTVVVIEDSTLEYLPHEAVESAEIRELQIRRTTLQQVFDKTPVALDTLNALIIDDIKIDRGNIWDLIQPMKALRFLYIFSYPIKTVGRDFSAHVNKNLVTLSLYRTETSKIDSGSLAEFRKLYKVEVHVGQLEVLTRDIFSTPFNGRYLSFNDQKLREIPEGMFSQMPNLRVVSFKKNLIATLPERAFDTDITGKVNIFLNENPLKCDCQIMWLINKKPHFLQGNCESPKKLHGKELDELTTHDFNC